MDPKSNIMKTAYYLILIGLIGSFTACEKDNFNEPESFLTGSIVYNGVPLQMGVNEVDFELWQPGFGKLGPLGVSVQQDGSFSSRLIDGDYKLVFGGGQGPFRTKVVDAQQLDTLFVAVRGNTQVEVEVTPYFIFNTAEVGMNGNTVEASCQLQSIIQEAVVERVTLYVNTTQFVSNSNDYNIAQANSGDVSNLGNITVSVALPEISPAQNYVFARIGVKIEGVEDMLFSPTERLTF
tara:strand:+ start:98641 stop:99351 length:711 start_codon:yes stop_codon:yes gene_type:complete